MCCHPPLPTTGRRQPAMSPGGFGRGDPRFEVVAPQRLAGAFVTPREPAARRTTISQSFGSMRRNTIRESKLQRVGWRNSLRNRGTGATPGWGTSPTPLPGLTRHAKPDPILSRCGSTICHSRALPSRSGFRPRPPFRAIRVAEPARKRVAPGPMEEIPTLPQRGCGAQPQKGVHPPG